MTNETAKLLIDLSKEILNETLTYKDALKKLKQNLKNQDDFSDAQNFLQKLIDKTPFANNVKYEGSLIYPLNCVPLDSYDNIIDEIIQDLQDNLSTNEIVEKFINMGISPLLVEYFVNQAITTAQLSQISFTEENLPVLKQLVGVLENTENN
jgi:hypothetical protein